MFAMKSMVNGNDLTVITNLARAFTFLQPDEYGQLRDFYQKVAAAPISSKTGVARDGGAEGELMVVAKRNPRSGFGPRGAGGCMG